MQDELDKVPADSIFFSEAFERVFDALRRDAPELRAVMEHPIAMTEKNLNSHDKVWARWNDDHLKWNEARAETQKWFRNELANGRLDFYQRDPVTGEKLRLNPNEFVQRYAFNQFSPAPLDPPVFFIKADFEKWLETIGQGVENNEPAPVTLEPTNNATNRRRGRTPAYDWTDIEAFVSRTMDENRDFDEGFEGWRSQADLHQKICDYLDKRNEQHPADSVLYERVAPMISRWREKNSRP